MSLNYYVHRTCETSCKHCEGETIHLGQSAAGWTFNFKGDPDWRTYGRGDYFDDWVTLAESGPIETENGVSIRLVDLLVLIAKKAADPDNRKHAVEYPGPDVSLYKGHSFSFHEFC